MRKVVLLGVVALAAATVVAASASAGSGKGIRAVPPGAVKVGEDTYYLGKRTVDGVTLEGYAFVHRRSEARPEKRPGGGGSTCYALLAAGAKWKATEPYRVDAGSSLVGSQMNTLIDQGIATWEASAGADIFGARMAGDYDARLDATDGVNGAEFGPIADAGVIAVTYTWGRFGGPTRSRSLEEWDMVFDADGDFAWATDGSSTAMDFLDIATHELGHAMGLGHPASTCTLETMYAYASLGETLKRDLNPGDVAGINVMY